MSGAEDRRFMRMALALGTRNLGRTWPNPSVGCVIVREGRVVGRGWTAPGGRPHAETEALRRAGGRARGATVYVTLEPCAHWGRTPPCAEALAEAGIARAVVACIDPDPRVNGRGLARLREAGIRVEEGCLEDLAKRQHLGLYRRILEGRPMVTLKLATSLDGRIATASGHSQWITGERARAFAHLLRARYDAVMVGSGTVLADDPDLRCRLPGLEEASPVRVIADRRLRFPPDASMLATASDVPIWIYTREGADPGAIERLRARGAEVIPLSEPCVAKLLADLAGRGITRLLVEGGGTLAGALLRAGVADRLWLAQAPMLLGGDGRAAVGGLALARVGEAPRLRLLEQLELDEDLVSCWEFVREGRPCSPVS